MEHIIRPLVLYMIFLILTSLVLKYFQRKDAETVVLEYKIDAYLNRIKKDILSGYYHPNLRENMEALARQTEPLPAPMVEKVVSTALKIPTVTPYSSFFNTYYLINEPQNSTQLRTTHHLI